MAGDDDEQKTLWLSLPSHRHHVTITFILFSRVLLVTILPEAVVIGRLMQTSRLADVQPRSGESFAKMLRLNVCKPIRLHNSFLLKYSNIK